MTQEEARRFVGQYVSLMDRQFAAYEYYARRFGLSSKELFVLYIIWFAPEGCLQSDISEQLSATKQTISAIVKKFWKLGYLSLTESEADRRNKIVRLTGAGQEYAGRIIPPVAQAENAAMVQLAENGEDVTELVRLTELFSRQIAKNFSEIKIEKP